MEKYKFKIQLFSIFNNLFRPKRSITSGLVDIDYKFLYNVLIGLVIDSRESIFPVNRDVYYCPVSLIGL